MGKREGMMVVGKKYVEERGRKGGRSEEHTSELQSP